MERIPNALTLLRGLLTAVIIGLFFMPIQHQFLIIWGLFVVASLTDFLDGYLARRWQVVSDFGIVFDSLFDKVLTVSLFFLLLPYYPAFALVFLLLVLRDLLVDGGKNFCLAKGHPVPANKLGKGKFVFQLLLLHAGVLLLAFPGETWLVPVMWGTGGGALLLAYVSAYQYLQHFLRILR